MQADFLADSKPESKDIKYKKNSAGQYSYLYSI